VKCRVYWGSHGCHKKRGHRGHHWCNCTPRWWKILPPGLRRWRGALEVGLYPYYGKATNFYGEDITPEQEAAAELRWARSDTSARKEGE
jgi:hypothetical protein